MKRRKILGFSNSKKKNLYRYLLLENGFSKKDLDIGSKILKSGNITMNTETKKFEEAFAKKLNVKYAVMTNSGSSANLLMAQVLLEGNFLKNKTVVLPSVSWSTTVSPFIQLGYKIILCDCDKFNLGLCTNSLERICKKYKPGLVLVVNVLGHSNNFQKLKSLESR